MFAHELDPQAGVGVVLLAAPTTDADWLEYAETIDGMRRNAPRHSPPVLVQIIRPGTTMPSAVVRKRLADLRGRMRSDSINLVVSTSPVLRAVQTALDWLRKPHYDSSTHADLDSAIAHLERKLGRPVPEVRVLAKRLLAKAA